MEEILEQARSDNKVQRKRALFNLKDHVTDDKLTDHDQVWSECYKTVIKCLEDESERCREASAEILLFFYTLQDLTEYHLHLSVPPLHKKLSDATSNQYETSEEVRVVFLKVLLALAQRSDLELRPFIDNFAGVIHNCLTDNFTDIKIICCDILKAMSESSFKEEFHFVAPTFPKHLVQNFTHQQKKVRLATVKSTG